MLPLFLQRTAASLVAKDSMGLHQRRLYRSNSFKAKKFHHSVVCNLGVRLQDVLKTRMLSVIGDRTPKSGS